MPTFIWLVQQKMILWREEYGFDFFFSVSRFQKSKRMEPTYILNYTENEIALDFFLSY